MHKLRLAESNNAKMLHLNRQCNAGMISINACMETRLDLAVMDLEAMDLAVKMVRTMRDKLRLAEFKDA